MITRIMRGAYLDRIGARAGDLIRQIDDIATNTVEEFSRAVVRYRQKSSLVILLQRDNYLYHITIKL